jgi:hypothetical protein
MLCNASSRESPWEDTTWKNGDGGDVASIGLTFKDNGVAHLLRNTREIPGIFLEDVALGQSPWWLVQQHLVAIVAAVNAATPGSFAEVEIPFSK